MQKMILPLFFSVGYSVKFLNFDRLHEFKMCIQLKESPLPLGNIFLSMQVCKNSFNPLEMSKPFCSKDFDKMKIFFNLIKPSDVLFYILT